MKSKIDWNEIVPRLGVGLQQTLYLEAVKMISARREAARDYQREYARRQGIPAPEKGSRRVWTAAMKRRVIAYYRVNGYTQALLKHRISGSMLNRWREEFPGRGRKKADGKDEKPEAADAKS